MTRFRKVAQIVSSIEDSFDASGGVVDAFTRVDGYLKSLEDVRHDVEGFAEKARIENEEEKVYGEKMVEKVLALEAQFDALVEKVDEERRRLEKAAKPVLEQLKEKAQEAMVNEQRTLREEEEEKRLQRENEIRECNERENLKKMQEEADRLERERLAFQKQEEERISYLNKKKSLEERDEIEKKERLRLEKSANTPFPELLVQLESENNPKYLKTIRRTLSMLVDNILQHPEASQFRKLRLLNENIQKDLIQFKLGLDALLSLGFKMIEEEKEVFLVLEEPDAETEMDQWMQWFDKLQEAKEALDTEN